MYRKLNETIYVDFLTHDPSTGKITNATTISGFVFEDNNDTPMYTPNIALRTGTTGNYRAELILTSANGFEINKSYNTIVQVLVGGIDAKANIASFYILNSTSDTISGQITAFPTAPTVGEIDSQLSGTHGAGNWTTADVSSLASQVSVDSVSGMINSLNDISAADVDTELSATHGSGSWDAIADTSTLTNYLTSISGIVTNIQTETDKISTILGLSQSNFRIKDATYTSGKLTSSVIRLYNSNTDCLADTNHFKEYTVAASYSGDELTSYTVTES